MTSRSTGPSGERRSLRERLSGEALDERLTEDAARKALVEQAERVVAEEAQLRERLKEDTVSRQQRRAFKGQQDKLHARRLRLLTRDDEGVLEILERERQIDRIVEGGHPTEVDEMLWFVVKELKLVEAFEALAPPPTYFDEECGEEVRRRQMYPPLVLNFIGLIARYMGLFSGPEVHARLLTDPRWMSHLGFSEEEVLFGASRRSESLTGKTRDGQGGKFEDAGPLGPARARLEGPRGALSPQTLAGHESALEAEEIVALFNATVRALAGCGLFSKKIRAVIDSTGEEVVPSFKDAGTVRKKVKAQSRARRPRQVEVMIRGFKLWYMMDVETGLPLAFAFDTIDKPENEHAKAVIDQARANLEGYARVESVALDRGFLDGGLLWWLKHARRIDWICPSKERMHVTAEARQRVAEVLAAEGTEAESQLETAQRLARGGKSYEGVSFSERQVDEHRDSLLVARVDELTCTDFYGPGGSSSSRVHSKAFQPTPLHGAVVLRWPDRSAKDRQDAAEHDEDSKGPVVLLSSLVENGLQRYDRYDERSLIENRLNRDGKQYFGLGAPLARNRSALLSATVMSTLALMFYRGLELHREQMRQAFDQRAEQLGVLRYRRQHMLLNRGTVLIIIGDRYARVRLQDVMGLLGVRVTGSPPKR